MSRPDRNVRQTVKIPITDDLGLEPLDDRNWGLCEWHGNKGWEPVAYWSSLEGALRGVANRLVERKSKALEPTSVLLANLQIQVARLKDEIFAELVHLAGRPR